MQHFTRTAGIAAWIVLLGLTIGCAAKADVTREQLSAVIERDAVAFDGVRLPDPVLDRLATNRVIVIGETHHLREHWAMITQLLVDLHDRGYRQLLVEAPQMADWLFDDYVTGGRLEPDLELPAFWLRRFEAIRAFNDTLPPEERVHLRTIDVNEEYYGGAAGFRAHLERLATHFTTPGPIDAFMNDAYDSPESQVRAIESLQTALASDRQALVATWGADRYDHVVEMAEVERASIDIRVERTKDDNSAARMREEVIKRIADARIGGDAGGTVINIGAHHAQKAHLMGTKQEWLGDYLVHRSTAVEGSVFVVGVTSARTVLEPGAGGTPVDVIETSPEHELHRVIAETRPDENVFLPLDDPLFADHRVAMNSEDTIYVTALKEQFDAVLQYALAHRMPVD